MPIKQDVQNLSPGGIVEMFELDATLLGVKGNSNISAEGTLLSVSNSNNTNIGIRSTNAIDWTIKISSIQAYWKAIVYSPKLKMFCITSWDKKIATSIDNGETWTEQVNPLPSLRWEVLTWSEELGIFCALTTGQWGSSDVLTSSDGVTWTPQNGAYNGHNWKSIVWSKSLGIFCAVSSTDSLGNSKKVMTSPDGINWTLQTTPYGSIVNQNYSWNAVTWSEELGIFCAVASIDTVYANKRTMTSSDGINWTIGNTIIDSHWRNVIWAKELNLFVSVASDGAWWEPRQCMVSSDGVNWTPKYIDNTAMYSFTGIVYDNSNSLLITNTSDGRIFTSSDGTTWTQQLPVTTDFLSDIAYAPPQSQSVSGPLIRFHSGKNEFKNDLIWQGNTYAAFPVEAEGFEVSTKGVLPKPTLRVANIDGSIGSLNRAYKDLVGAKVTRKRTLTKYLDASNFIAGNPLADPNEAFPDDVFYVNRKVSENRVFVEYELVSVMDVEEVKLPRRQVIQNICTWKYRSPECSYAGTNYFDANDNPVSNLEEDVCSKKLSGCKARFPEPLSLPYGGFPGTGLF